MRSKMFHDPNIYHKNSSVLKHDGDPVINREKYKQNLLFLLQIIQVKMCSDGFRFYKTPSFIKSVCHDVNSGFTWY